MMSVPVEPPPDYEYAVSHPPPVLPPGYQVAAILPSYHQAEIDKEKLLAGHDAPPPPRATRRESIAERGEWDEEERDMDLTLLGTDLAFFTAFLAAFLFNWVGFLLLMCFCHTIAARYGALAGFGLSLSKWTLIVKRSTDMVRDENAWLWWLVLAFGFLICMRACAQFVQIKRSWRHLSSSARERLFFFY
eukprot:TRINITY_DN2260_c0_g1_i1.p1 TRINITY_DN2260_c0_g1~~TRINITY_DN2260_c0_g1_i1.p1  ORF type:complete len:190 (-),score=60.01 TRINITY_DN2260_c0_g1_i1:119-688(-)